MSRPLLPYYVVVPPMRVAFKISNDYPPQQAGLTAAQQGGLRYKIGRCCASTARPSNSGLGSQVRVNDRCW